MERVVTERVEAEAEAKRSRRAVSAAVRAMPAGLGAGGLAQKRQGGFTGLRLAFF